MLILNGQQAAHQAGSVKFPAAAVEPRQAGRYSSFRSRDWRMNNES